MKVPKLDAITFVAACILFLIGALGYAIFYVPGAGDQLKTIYAQSLLLALAAVTGYYLNSSADQAKKDSPDAPAQVTTTVTTGVQGDVPKVPEVPAMDKENRDV